MNPECAWIFVEEDREDTKAAGEDIDLSAMNKAEKSAQGG